MCSLVWLHTGALKLLFFHLCGAKINFLVSSDAVCDRRRRYVIVISIKQYNLKWTLAGTKANANKKNRKAKIWNCHLQKATQKVGGIHSAKLSWLPGGRAADVSIVHGCKVTSCYANRPFITRRSIYQRLINAMTRVRIDTDAYSDQHTLVPFDTFRTRCHLARFINQFSGQILRACVNRPRIVMTTPRVRHECELCDCLEFSSHRLSWCYWNRKREQKWRQQ